MSSIKDAPGLSFYEEEKKRSVVKLFYKDFSRQFFLPDSWTVTTMKFSVPYGSSLLSLGSLCLSLFIPSHLTYITLTFSSPFRTHTQVLSGERILLVLCRLFCRVHSYGHPQGNPRRHPRGDIQGTFSGFLRVHATFKFIYVCSSPPPSFSLSLCLSPLHPTLAALFAPRRTTPTSTHTSTRTNLQA